MAQQLNSKNHVPRGDYFWNPTEQDKYEKLACIVDPFGEIFLTDEEAHHLYWGHETLLPPHSLYVAQGVKDYLDFDANENWICHHNGDSKRVVSFNAEEPDIENKRKNLENALKLIYKTGKLEVECGKLKFAVDYDTGEESTDKTRHNFWITRNEYRIVYKSREPATLRWKLEFSTFDAVFPGSSCPCLVYHTKSLGDFIDLCKSFKIDKLPGGRLLDDYVWMSKYKTNNIELADEYSPWIDNIKEGHYEGSAAVIMRMPKRGHNLQHLIKKLRDVTSACSGIIRFFGWKETGNHHLVAYEKCPWDLQSYAENHKLDVELVRNLGTQVYLLHDAGTIHGNLTPRNVFVTSNNVVKLGLPSSFTLDDGLNPDLPILAKLVLLLSSPEYQFNKQLHLTDTDFEKCKNLLLRRLIRRLSSSLPENLDYFVIEPWFWDTNATVEFISIISDLIGGARNPPSEARKKVTEQIKKRKVFNSVWFKKGDRTLLDESYVNERVTYSKSMNPVLYDDHPWLEPYDFTDGSDLVIILRNGFTHIGQMDDNVRIKVGRTKLEMVLYMNATFPKLLPALHAAGLEIFREEIDDPDKPPTNLRIFYEGRLV